LGIEGLAEVVELELTEPLPAEEVSARLTLHAPPGLEMTEVRPIDPRQSARVARATYRLALPPERLAGLPTRCNELLARPALPVQRPRPGAAPAAAPVQGMAAGVQEELDALPPAPRPPGRKGGKDRHAPKTVDLRPYLESLAVRDHALE